MKNSQIIKQTKKTFLILSILVFNLSSVSFAQEKISLSGQWDFSNDKNLEKNNSWVNVKYNSSKWFKINIPGNWDTENDYSEFKGTGYFRKSFVVPKDWNKGKIFLQFGAVYQKCDVWLNGSKLGSHIGGYTPFEFNITDKLVPGKKNTIAISVNNKYKRGAWWHWGGISRDVTILRYNQQRIMRQQIIATPNLKTGTSEVTNDIFIKNYDSNDFSGKLIVSILDKHGNETIGEKIEQKITAKKSESLKLNVKFNLNKGQTKLWDVNAPNLYKISTTLISSNNDTVHQVVDRFGIRKIEVQGSRMLLNGKVIYLNGFNRVGDHRAYGQTEPEHLVKFDIDAMRAMGCNFTRIMHYPQPKILLDYCDEIGMLLFEEIPVWGKGDPQLIPENPLTKQWLTEMIERDFNHPSIIGWSVANEIADKDKKGRQMSPKVYGFVETMFNHVDNLDTTRLKTYVSFTATKADTLGIDPADLCDVVCYNSYGPAYKQAVKLHNTWPNKPIFFSEIGKKQVGESLTESGLSETLINEIKKLDSLDYVIGSSLWTYNDYRSLYGGTPKSQNRAWGAYNVWRQPKKAAYDIRELYTRKESNEKLPSLAKIPVNTPDSTVYIEAIVPLQNSCMVGYTVIDKKDDYEIEYKSTNKKSKIVKIKGLRGAAKIYGLKPGKYDFRIRRIHKGNKGEWSSVYGIIIE